MQFTLAKLKTAITAQPGILMANLDCKPLLRNIPFALTTAQEKVFKDICKDMGKGNRMNRLIQGDVGSGKTVVALLSAYLAISNGYQAALMAPTEVLAQQHYQQCQKYLAPLGIETVLLLGTQGTKERREALAKLKSGQAQMAVGTHALIQSGVEFSALALAIVDEQHRFGVNQRQSLTEKGNQPHILVMTATPIPRTLGLILYGDMDISIIDELPPGRQEIKTYAVDSSYRNRIHEFIRREVSEGRQVYVICPAIEESETISKTKTEMQNVLKYTADLTAALSGIKITCLHGRMKPGEKQSIMDDFQMNHIQVLVSTTVIEVGIHNPNAALMIIENAERFGLSQLHQLRGRVGRGEAQSHCVLITDARHPQTKARIQAMTKTTDGFKLAELDLEERGAGDFFGTRQHGLPTFTIANLYRDVKVLEEVQEAAHKVLSGEFVIKDEEVVAMNQRVMKTEVQL